MTIHINAYYIGIFHFKLVQLTDKNKNFNFAFSKKIIFKKNNNFFKFYFAKK